MASTFGMGASRRQNRVSTALKSDPFRQAKTAPRPGVDSRDGDRGGGGNYTSSLGGIISKVVSSSLKTILSSALAVY